MTVLTDYEPCDVERENQAAHGATFTRTADQVADLTGLTAPDRGVGRVIGGKRTIRMPSR